MSSPNLWIQAQAQMELFFYSPIENKNLFREVSESLLSEKRVRLYDYFNHYFQPKAPRFFNRMKKELTRDQIIVFMSSFVSSEQFIRRIPKKLINGRFSEKNLSYTFLRLWSAIDYLTENSHALPDSLRIQVLANLKIDAVIFDLVWPTDDFSSLKSHFAKEASGLGFRENIVVLKLEAYPDLSSTLAQLSGTAIGHSYFAFNLHSTVELIEFFDVTGYILDPIGLRNLATSENLLNDNFKKKEKTNV